MQATKRLKQQKLFFNNCQHLHLIIPEEATTAESKNDTLEIKYDSFAYFSLMEVLPAGLEVRLCQQRHTSDARKTKAASKEQQTALVGLIRSVSALPAGT